MESLCYTGMETLKQPHVSNKDTVFHRNYSVTHTMEEHVKFSNRVLVTKRGSDMNKTACTSKIKTSLCIMWFLIKDVYQNSTVAECNHYYRFGTSHLGVLGS